GLEAGDVSAFVEAVALGDVLLGHGDAVLGESVAVAAHAVEGGAGVLSADMRDAAAALLDEVAGRHLADLYVVRPDKVRGEIREVAVEQKVGRLLVAQFVKIAQLRLTRRDQQNVDAAGKKGANLLLLDFGIFFRRGQDQCLVRGPQNAAERLGELRKEGVHKVGNDEA